MNIEPQQLERLLRKAPRPAAPEGLLEKLKADIDLPSTPRVERDTRPAPSFLRRWLPALSVAIWLLACVIILAVQSSLISTLRSENEDLRAAASQSEQKNIKSPVDELTKLRADNEEVRRLKAEVARLSEQLNELESLRAENRRLAAELQAINSIAAPTHDDFFGKAAETVELLTCIDNLKHVCLAARIWSNDHGEVMPQEFSEFEKILNGPKKLFCLHGQGTTQYEIVSPGVGEEDPSVVYLRCPHHPAVALIDGSVQQIGSHKLVVRADGKTVIGN